MEVWEEDKVEISRHLLAQIAFTLYDYGRTTNVAFCRAVLVLRARWMAI